MAGRDDASNRQGNRRLLASDDGASTSRESGIDAGDIASCSSSSSSSSVSSVSSSSSNRNNSSSSSSNISSSRESGVDLSTSQDYRCDVVVGRPTLNVKERASKCHYSPPPKPGIFESIQTKAKDSCTYSGKCCMSAMVLKVPILSWLPAYNLRASLFRDVVAGITVAIMHIPQGMASAVLGGLPPITGIYMAFFPVLMYACLGTSRHCSMGTFAVVMQMTGKLVDDFATEENSDEDANSANVTESPPTIPPDGNVVHSLATNAMQTYTPNQVAAIVALTSGILQVAFGVLQLGNLCVFLSDMLVSGFTTGAAVHVLISQIKNLFGIKVKRYSGPFKIIYTLRDLISNLLSASPATMVISTITISVLVLNNELLKPWFSKKSKIPIPIELFVVIIGTLTSYLADLHHTYNIRIVGKIPTGLPDAQIPPVALMSSVVVDAAVISVVAYIVSFSMAKILSKRKNYNVDATQELYALGVSNIFGSFFGCGPIASSFARTLIQESAGGVTQMASFVCCAVLLIVLLLVGPLFETLPNCVLSPIIVVALKGMLTQVSDARTMWAVSRTDAMIWVATFSGVILIDIDYGLILGVVVSVMVLLARSQKPTTARLGRVPNTDLYLDVQKYSATVEIPAVIMFQFRGPLHFANSEYFRNQLVHVTGLDPFTIATSRASILKERQLEEHLSTQLTKKESIGSASKKSRMTNKTLGLTTKIMKKSKHVTLALPDVDWLVVEMSGISYIDSSGGCLLSQLCKEYMKAGITLCLAAPSENVLETLEVCGTLKVIPQEHIFHSAHDAVMMITHPSTPVATEASTQL